MVIFKTGYSMPQANEWLYCIRCAEYRTVIGQPIGYWYFKCDDCPNTRSYRGDQRGAEKGANFHFRRKMHTVRLFKDNELMQVYRPQIETLIDIVTEESA